MQDLELLKYITKCFYEVHTVLFDELDYYLDEEMFPKSTRIKNLKDMLGDDLEEFMKEYCNMVAGSVG